MNPSQAAPRRGFGARRIPWVALLAATAAMVSSESAGAGTAPGGVSGSAHRFEPQTISWHACKTGPDDDTAHKLGTLIVNTGGIGPSRDGVTAIAKGLPGLSPHGAPHLAARYDLVGSDPRFFGKSTPLECGWPTNLALRFRQFAAPDRSSFRASVANAKDLAARCKPFADRLPFGSTRDIARDMDIVRAVLGQARISYLGWSYGTYLGAVYLQMFPDRVGRIVLDSALDPEVYGPGATRPFGPADAAALKDWAGWAAERSSRFGLGDTADAVLAGVDRIYAVARRHPLRVGSYQVDGTMIAGLLLTVEDTDAAYADFSAKVRNLRDAAIGRKITPAPALAQLLALYANTDVLAELNLSATTANQCADRAASRNPETYWRDIRDHLATE